MTAEEMAEVRDARDQWFQEKISMKESIPEIYGRLSRVFSFNESNIYRIRIQVTELDGSAAVNKEAVINLDRTLPRYRENAFSGLNFWRKVNF